MRKEKKRKRNNDIHDGRMHERVGGNRDSKCIFMLILSLVEITESTPIPPGTV
jgi:hypothetical protein